MLPSKLDQDAKLRKFIISIQNQLYGRKKLFDL